MAHKKTQPVRALEDQIVLLNARIDTDGAGAYSAIVGKGFTGSRVAAGHYRFTLTSRWPVIRSAYASIEKDDLTTDREVRIKVIDRTNQRIDVMVYDPTAAAGDAADLVSGSIHLLLVVSQVSKP